MAIIKSCVKLIISNDSTYHYSGKVLALGVPEIYATLADLMSCFPALAGKEFPLSPSDVKTSTHEVGKKLKWVTADTFFRSLGLTSIISLDIPGSEYNPDLVHDLNNPLPSDLYNQFDMVIDPGTIEHVFDIKTALTGIVHALKVGGIVIHQVPVYSYNGGYYSINPNVLNDFYTVNGFDELKTYIVMWDRYHVYTGKNLCYEYSEAIMGARHALADYDQCRYSPHMLFFARKHKEVNEINIPLQFSGEYMSALANGNQSEDVGFSLIPVIKSIQSILYCLLPYEIAYYLNAFARRLLFLYQTRHVSFWI
jgi:hypothetical protein